MNPRWKLSLCCALALLTLGGCVDEELELNVQPDGSAKVELTCTLKKNLQTELASMFSSRELTAEEQANQAAAKYLATFEGVSAWTNVEVTQLENATRCKATGWVPDLGQLRRRSPLATNPSQLRGWELARGEAKHAATLSGLSSRFDVHYTPETVLDGTPEALEGLRRAVSVSLGTLQVFQRGMSSTVHVNLPSAPLTHSGWSKVEGTRASVEGSLKWARQQNQELHDALLDVHTRFSAGSLTREVATAEIERLRGAAGACRVSWKAGPASPKFKVALEAAQTAWPGSPWQVALEEAEEQLAREAVERAERKQEEAAKKALEAAIPDDAFEPNNSFRRAAELGAGTHENLTLKDEDWYKITVPANQELRVEVRYAEEEFVVASFFVGRERPIDLEFSDSEGLRSARCAVRKQTTFYLELQQLGDAHGYTLTVSLSPFQPADAHEPNDIINQARMLEAGQHDGLTLSGGADWYAFKCPPDAVVGATLLVAEGTQPLELELRTWSGNLYEATANGTSAEGTLRCRGYKGRVMVRVSGAEGTTYGLRLEAGDEPAPDAFEPNNQRRMKLKVLEPGEHAELWADPVDYYRLDVPPGSELTVVVSAADEGAELDCALKLKGEYGSVQSASGREVTLVYLAPAAGAALHLEVEAKRLRRYTLQVALAESAVSDPFEPNDTRDAAKPLPPGEHEVQLIGEDWYAVALQAGEAIRATVGATTRGSLELSLHDAQGMRRAEGYPLDFMATAAGTYYVRVVASHSSVPSPFPYRLTLERPTPQVYAVRKETKAIKALRAILSAQLDYREAHLDERGKTTYTSDLAVLRADARRGEDLVAGEQDGYRFAVCVGSSDPAFRWMAVASPTDPKSGRPHFVINHDGQIHSGEAPFALDPKDCEIPAGATPIER